MVHAGGRPRKYTKDQVDEIIAKFEEYIKYHDVPIIAEFAYENDIIRESLYDYQEFSTVLKKCTAKKEAALERGMLSGKFPPAAAIFSLKQLGWSDRHELEHSGNMGVTLIDDVK